MFHGLVISQGKLKFKAENSRAWHILVGGVIRAEKGTLWPEES